MYINLDLINGLVGNAGNRRGWDLEGGSKIPKNGRGLGKAERLTTGRHAKSGPHFVPGHQGYGRLDLIYRIKDQSVGSFGKIIFIYRRDFSNIFKL